jgi:ParB family chromosome partitioning protein
VIDQTTVAHHLALLDLPPVLDAALTAGRCRSPRTLYELSKLHAEQPERVAELVAGSQPITRDAVAEIRDAATGATEPMRASTPTLARPNQTAQTLTKVNRLCARLEMALLLLSRTALDAIPPDDLAVLRHRVAALPDRLGP